MAIRRGALVFALIVGLVTAGCQQSPPSDSTVCDYQPGKPATQVYIEDQGVYALLRRDKTTAEGLATEVNRFAIDGGSTLGFKMDHERLIAVAGSTTLPLETGWYTWEVLSGDAATRKREQDQKREHDAITAFAICTLGVGLLAIIFFSDIVAAAFHTHVGGSWGNLPAN